MEANQEETTEPPRLRTNPSKRETLPQSLSAADGNNTSMNSVFSLTIHVPTWTY